MNNCLIKPNIPTVPANTPTLYDQPLPQPGSDSDFPGRCVVVGGLLGRVGNLALKSCSAGGRALEAELATREELVSATCCPPVSPLVMLGTTRERKDGMVDKEAVAVLLLWQRKQLQGGLKGSAVGPRTPTATGELAPLILLWGGGICTDLGLVISGQFTSLHSVG